MNEQKNNTNDKWTKLIFAVLLFFGISTVLLGILRLNSSIHNQFLINGARRSKVEGNSNNFSQSKQQPSITELMKRDTDQDGLSDYEELYIYHTSIYLKDTDGDGYDDKEEVDNGYDPNCPKGKDCRGMKQVTKGVSETAQGNATDTTAVESNSLNNLTQQQKDELKKLSPQQVRQLLLSSGQISQTELDKINDEQLMQTFNEMLNK